MTVEKQVLPSPAWVTVALLLLAAATPPARGQMSAVIDGRLCCTFSGNCPPEEVPIAGAVVSLNCTSSLTGGSVSVGQGVTGADGVYNFSVDSKRIEALGPIPYTVLGGQLPCAVVVELPLNQTVCPDLSTATGILAAALTPVSTVLSLLGPIGRFTATEWVNLNA